MFESIKQFCEQAFVKRESREGKYQFTVCTSRIFITANNMNDRPGMSMNQIMKRIKRANIWAPQNEHIWMGERETSSKQIGKGKTNVQINENEGKKKAGKHTLTWTNSKLVIWIISVRATTRNNPLIVLLCDLPLFEAANNYCGLNHCWKFYFDFSAQLVKWSLNVQLWFAFCAQHARAVLCFMMLARFWWNVNKQKMQMRCLTKDYTLSLSLAPFDTWLHIFLPRALREGPRWPAAINRLIYHAQANREFLLFHFNVCWFIDLENISSKDKD